MFKTYIVNEFYSSISTLQIPPKSSKYFTAKSFSFMSFWPILTREDGIVIFLS